MELVSADYQRKPDASPAPNEYAKIDRSCARDEVAGDDGDVDILEYLGSYGDDI